MCSIEQCSRCRLDFDKCGYYNNTDPALCSHFVKPIDNSKMFARWHKFSGRIGRLEYAIALVMAIALYFFILFVVGLTLGATGYYQEYSKTELYMFSIGCMIPSVYIAIAAGVKRTHDTRVSSWYSLVPLIPLFFLNVVTFVIFCAGCIFLFKDAGEDGINEHGSNPTQSYEEQLNIEKMY